MNETKERSVGSAGSVLYAIVEYLRSLAGVRLNERERKLVILLDDAKHEIARLRLTDAEREALTNTREWMLYGNRHGVAEAPPTIDALLKRHAKGGGA